MITNYCQIYCCARERPKGAKAMGGNPDQIEGFVENLEKLYSSGRDMSAKEEYSRLHGLYSSDLVRK